jgi:hypothetical protein
MQHGRDRVTQARPRSSVLLIAAKADDHARIGGHAAADPAGRAPEYQLTWHVDVVWLLHKV